MKETYVESRRRRIRDARERESTRAESARLDLDKIITILKGYRVKRIILFGSLATEHRFGKGSDIDIAVEGLERKDFIRAYADLIMALNWPIDLKPLEDIDGLFREMIMQRGKIIYER